MQNFAKTINKQFQDNFEKVKKEIYKTLKDKDLLKIDDNYYDNAIEKIKDLNLNELLNNINVGAMFYSGLDNDAVLVSIAAGGDVPHIAAWDKNGYRPYIMTEPDEEYHPISRNTFMGLVKIKEPLI
jgi:hypothetical protein